MLTAQKLQKVLRSLSIEAAEIVVEGTSKFVATVTSNSFASLNEAERQARVWEHLRNELEPDELIQVEFILTNAPGDLSEEE